MMDRFKAASDFITSSYKRLAAILIIGGLVLAIPITMSVVSNQQDVRQRASEVLTSNSLLGTYNYTGSCTSGCTGDFKHTMTITAVAPEAESGGTKGSFAGTGFYDAAPSVTWNVTGTFNLTAKTMTFHLVYTGASAGYTVDGTGILGSDGVMEGT